MIYLILFGAMLNLTSMHLNVEAGEIIGNDRLIEDIEGNLARRRSTSGPKSNHEERAVAYRRFARRSRPPLPNNLGAALKRVVELPWIGHEIGYDTETHLKDRSKEKVQAVAEELFGETSQMAA